MNLTITDKNGNKRTIELTDLTASTQKERRTSYGENKPKTVGQNSRT